MDQVEKPKLTRKQIKNARKAANDVVVNVAEALVKGNLSRFDNVFNMMEGLVSRFNLPIDGFADTLANLRTTTDAALAREKDQFAARWAGDMPRMRALQEVPYPDTSHLLPDISHLMGDLHDNSAEDEPEDDMPAEDTPDTYADLVAGRPGALDALIARQHDLNTRSGPYDLTAIQAALDMPGRSAEILERLAAAGGDAALPGPNGEDAIFCAVGYGHSATVTAQSERELFAFMFNAGCNPNAQGSFRGTPLLAAIALGSTTEINILLDAGARLDVAKPDSGWHDAIDGFTPLMMAAPKPETFRLLLDRGADPTSPGANNTSLEQFIADEAAHARNRATDDWTAAHADALEQSLQMLRDHLRRA
jgi:Ankyrin repeats (3 copies)